jgi:hypothetical protein
LGKYTDSVRAGTADTEAQIEAVHKDCADTKFILAGYSQGAQAVGDALQRMPASDRDLVVAAVFFGDPYFNAQSWSARTSVPDHYGVLGVRDEWPEALHGRIFSYCHAHDPICGLSKKAHILGDGDLYYRDFGWLRGTGKHVFDPHENYPSPAGASDATDAARQIARVIGAPTPGTGTVPLDLAFAIDTTGSMGDTIAQVRDNVTNLAQAIASVSHDNRFALVDYKDGPDQGDAYKARVDQSFTTDVDAFTTAVGTLDADGGGDTPESVYSGVMTALNLPWRPGVRKVVIPIGDAPGKDPEPDTGFTRETVRQKALAVDPAQIYPVPTSPDAVDFMTAMATDTGGKVTTSTDPSTFVDELKSAIVSAGSAPVADVGGPYTGVVNDPIHFSAGGSRDESEDITGYDWDFNGDGTVDLSTADPVVAHTYAAAGTYQLIVRVRAKSGLTATATTAVTVTAAPRRPGQPTGLRAIPGDGSVTLSWRSPAGPSPTWYTITDGSGALIERVSATGSSLGWADDSVSNGALNTYKVSAGNVAGESTAAGPVSARAGGPSGITPPPTHTTAPASSSTTAAGPSTTSGSTPGALGHTGAPTLRIVLLGLVLIATGAGTLMYLAARRRESEDRM